MQGDVCKMADLDRLFEETNKRFGKIDILVPNAGVGGRAPITEVDEEMFDRITNTNYKGTYFTIKKAVPFMNKGSSIIPISSVTAHIALAGATVYSATKAAISHMVRCLSTELLPLGIRVNSISPGYIDTPIFDYRKAQNPDLLIEAAKMIPAQRIGRPDEIASTVAFLASKEGEYYVGFDMVIDGGIKAAYMPAVMAAKKEKETA